MTEIPKKTKQQTVLGQHKFRKNAEGKPLLRWFTKDGFAGIPSIVVGDKIVKNGGWSKVSPKALQTPPEAKEVQSDDPGAAVAPEAKEAKTVEPKTKPDAKSKVSK